METKNALQILRKRRMFLLFLPIVALPLLTLLFWAAGGGGTGGVKAIREKKGFNLNLPNAKNDDDAKLSKFNYYESAAIDSAKLEELRKKDPNYTVGNRYADTTEAGSTAQAQRYGPKQGLNMVTPDPAEEKLYSKLEQLKKAVREPIRSSVPLTALAAVARPRETSAELQRLEQMMQAMQGQGEPEDREMQQINGMLENILDIQYPQRLQEKMKKASIAERGKVFPVQMGTEEQPVTYLKGQESMGTFSGGRSHNRFYSLDENQGPVDVQNAVEATIAETQTLVNGSTVKMKLGQDIYISGVKIPANTFVFGTASLKGERLSVKVAGIRYGSSIYPVDLTVYDLDGLDGLYIPGAISRDVAKASADQSMQSLGITSMDDSWSAQAAGAGVEAAKSLLSKKVKLVKVIVKAGYQLLLHDEKQKDKP